MPTISCPRCSARVEKPAQGKPVCPSCGYGRPSGAAGAAARPAPVSASQPRQAIARPPPGAQQQWQGSAGAPGTRPGWVTFAAVMHFIGAGFGALVALLLFVVGGTIAAMIPGLGAVGGAIIMVVAVVFLGLAVLSLFVALGLLKGQSWARITAIVLAAVGVLFGLVGLIAGDFSQVLAIALNVLILVGLTRPASTAFFAGAQARPAPRAPVAR